MTLPVQPGELLLGKYRVERVLGRGGMGVVVSARHIELGELFAIKFLLPAALALPDAVERFLREARASARLKGEHVVRVHDVGRLPDGMPYMVMEHLSGSDLLAVVRERGPLPIVEALSHVLHACEALAEAHALGMVHRDLKPANMFLVRRPDGSPCVKVLDFGISKQIEPETAEQQALTRTGVILGSPLYMSPEQMLRTKEADPRADLWSMGVVLYQLLTGKVPFFSEAVTEVVGKVLQEEPLPPSHHRSELPPAVDAIVMRCLQKRREQRFQTVQELMAALRGVLAAAAAPHGLSGFAGTPSVSTAPLPIMVPPAVASASLAGSEVPGPSHAAKAVANPAAISGPAAQTGQAWGATGQRASTVPGRTRIVFGAVMVVLVLAGGGVLAAWRYGGAAEGTPAATSDSAPERSASGASTTGPVTPASAVPPSGSSEPAAASEAPAASNAPSASAAPAVPAMVPGASDPPARGTAKSVGAKAAGSPAPTPTVAPTVHVAPAATGVTAPPVTSTAVPPPTAAPTAKKKPSMY